MVCNHLQCNCILWWEVWWQYRLKCISWFLYLLSLVFYVFVCSYFLCTIIKKICKFFRFSFFFQLLIWKYENLQVTASIGDKELYQTLYPRVYLRGLTIRFWGFTYSNVHIYLVCLYLLFQNYLIWRKVFNKFWNNQNMP